MNKIRFYLALVVIFASYECDAFERVLSKQKLHFDKVSGKAIDVDYFAHRLADEDHVYRVLRDIAIVRPSGSRNNKRVANLLSNAMRKLKWDVKVDSSRQNTIAGRIRFKNVIATLNPNATRRLVLACHFDSKKLPSGFLGVCDSAVPCAQMVNLAHVMDAELKANAITNDITLQFIFFDGEEPFESWRDEDHTYGSRHLANKWARQGRLEAIDLFVLLDLIGPSDTKFVSLKEPSDAWYQSMLATEQNLFNEKAMFKPDRAFSAGVEDDHMHFEDRGIDVLHLISYPFPRVWHTLKDDLKAVDKSVVKRFNAVLRTFVAKYLQLRPQNEK